MSRRTHNYNAYESELTGPLNIGASSVAVLSAAGLQDPIYLIVDPDVPAKREWIRVNTINGNTLENIVRNLQGSVGDVLHDTGAKVRSVPTSQIFDDIFQDAEDDELDLTQHETDGGNPHAQAGYLQDDDVNGVYLKLTGGTLSGFLSLVADPTLPAHAANMNYVDNNVFDKLHASLTDVGSLPDAHHTKYLDSEAVDAMGLVGDGNDLNHVKYTDADAIAATGGEYVVESYVGGRTTDANGDFSITVAGKTLTGGIGNGAQVGFPAALVVESMVGDTITFRAYGLQNNGIPIANSSIAVAYMLFGA